MDLSMIETLLSTIDESLPKYMEVIEEEFRQKHGDITEEQQEVFDFVEKRATEFVSIFKPLG